MPYKRCDKCNGWLRVRIVMNEQGKMVCEPFGNYTTPAGGAFCSTGCAIWYQQSQSNPQDI